MDDRKEISELLNRWNRAVVSGEPEQVVNCYAEDAILIPTLSCRIRHNHLEIADYFEHFLSGEPEGVIREENIRMYGDIAINSGLYDFKLTKRGRTISGRFTFVYRKFNEGWLIVEHHSSLLPE